MNAPGHLREAIRLLEEVEAAIQKDGVIHRGSGYDDDVAAAREHIENALRIETKAET